MKSIISNTGVLKSINFKNKYKMALNYNSNAYFIISFAGKVISKTRASCFIGFPNAHYSSL